MTEVSTAPLLKTDSLGRMRTPAARREQLLDEFEKSGVSGQQFAELVGLKYQTFATWVQRRQRRRAGRTRRKTAKVRWLEATVARTPERGGADHLLVQLPGGARMELSCLTQIRLAVALLRALENSSAAC